MDILILLAVAFGASWLTFFSGFGLGTLLLPAFAWFFPAEVALAATGVVHLLNNLFKTGLVGRHADMDVLKRFGFPAILGASVGAMLADWLSTARTPLWAYEWLGETREILPFPLAIGLLMVVFALLEFRATMERWQLSERWLPLGGVLSGLFGGLSGHQGALRSAFLLKAGLSKEAFVATGVAIAVLVDITRLGIYVRSPQLLQELGAHWQLILMAVLAAFAGAMLGKLFLRKAKWEALQTVVALLLMLFGAALALGLV